MRRQVRFHGFVLFLLLAQRPLALAQDYAVFFYYIYIYNKRTLHNPVRGRADAVLGARTRQIRGIELVVALPQDLLAFTHNKELTMYISLYIYVHTFAYIYIYIWVYFRSGAGVFGQLD